MDEWACSMIFIDFENLHQLLNIRCRRCYENSTYRIDVCVNARQSFKYG